LSKQPVLQCYEHGNEDEDNDANENHDDKACNAAILDALRTAQADKHFMKQPMRKIKTR
jgi:hypothetical protein